ncbi:MAG: phosphoglycerate kinase [Bacillota bacterium]
MPKATIRDVDVQGKRCLVRVDFNVPIKDGLITDDSRIRAAVPTIEYLRRRGAKIILMSHLGRPKGKVVEDLRLGPVAIRLKELLGIEVAYSDECVGLKPQSLVAGMKPGDVLLLENLRFHDGEEKNDPEFSREFSSLGDVYVNDAFGTAHRAHASTAGIADYLPAYAGLLMEKEISFLGTLLANPDRPFAAVIGGAKVSDKLSVLSNLLEKVDVLLIGGGMANTFHIAQGYGVGTSLAEPGKAEDAKVILDKATRLGKTVYLPVDVVVAARPEVGVPAQVVSSEAIPDDLMVLDIGPETRKVYSDVVAQSRTVFWNGPLGVFEIEPFRGGTLEMAAAIAGVRGLTVVGGGDSLSAMEMSGLSEKISHLSTGGGASLEFLEGKTLPGVACLKEK